MVSEEIPVDLGAWAHRPGETRSVLGSRWHPGLQTELTGAMPAVVALDDDHAAAMTAGDRLEDFAPHERRAQEHQTLEIDLDFGEELANVFVDVTQPLTDRESVRTARRRAALRADEIVEHEERGVRGSSEPMIWTRDEARNPPRRGSSVTGFGRDAQPPPQCTKAASGNSGESRDHIGTDLEANEAFGEREATNLAIDGVLWGGGFHGATQ